MSEENQFPVLLVQPGRMPRKGLRFKGELVGPARTSLAASLVILSVDALSWEMHARPWRKNGFELTGNVTGRATQACIVTLEPVGEEIIEELDLRFLPEEKALAPKRAGAADALDVEFDAAPDDAPETFTGDTVDVWPYVAEHFALGLNPYPRKPGAAFAEAGQAEPEGALARALRQWKGGGAAG
jgi:hypothetical protein